MEKVKSIEVLNRLIEINNDRIAGYETASEETEESDLKNLFSRLKQTSLKCKSELTNEVVKLGGEPTEGTKTTGKFFRVWMDIKSTLTSKDRKAILNSCEFGEDIAVNIYQKVLRDDLEDINAEQQAMIDTQFTLIKADHDKVKELRDAMVDAYER